MIFPFLSKEFSLICKTLLTLMGFKGDWKVGVSVMGLQERLKVGVFKTSVGLIFVGRS